MRARMAASTAPASTDDDASMYTTTTGVGDDDDDDDDGEPATAANATSASSSSSSPSTHTSTSTAARRGAVAAASDVGGAGGRAVASSCRQQRSRQKAVLPTPRSPTTPSTDAGARSESHLAPSGDGSRARTTVAGAAEAASKSLITASHRSSTGRVDAHKADMAASCMQTGKRRVRQALTQIARPGGHWLIEQQPLRRPTSAISTGLASTPTPH